MCPACATGGNPGGIAIGGPFIPGGRPWITFPMGSTTTLPGGTPPCGKGRACEQVIINIESVFDFVCFG